MHDTARHSWRHTRYNLRRVLYTACKSHLGIFWNLKGSQRGTVVTEFALQIAR